MADIEQGMPQQDQHELLAAHGFTDAFWGLWIERNDVDEIAELLQLDFRTRRDATLREEASAMADPSVPLDEKNSLWLGRHNSDWSVVVSPVGVRAALLPLSAGDRKTLEISWLQDVDGLYPLYFHAKGGEVSEEIEPFWDGHLPESSVFERYVQGLVRDYGDDESDVPLANAFLVIVGRMTGRFIDEEWFQTLGRVYDHPSI
ncbi:hypothetical protein HCN51_14265 [Nonomuraea sp. FMUSA5-5]|uniref:CdiI immunity protein domain-containing protein n=1 Tax=Nonomuraea composti TaxID=2720023 RepID=A0ABX1B606_9ACTN|nr:hypothetical protein [Nonomuraea sp. FMUSA5-5]NJP90603.1 hypothetical protein [Nonomuraea sp. FMUSA5-5]